MSSLAASRLVRVDLGARSYEVVIGRGLILQLEPLRQARGLLGPPFFLYDDKLPAQKPIGDLIAQAGRAHLALPGGEATKALRWYGQALEHLAEGQTSRQAVIVAIGGGVIGDLAGFVAATYLRGVDLMQVPTTLLAMVDSAVGGKTGINLPQGKNLVGAFHQPRLVLIDLDTLATLPIEEFRAGLAEVLKYGAIQDAALFARVAEGVEPGAADLAEIVARSVEIKARLIERDEFEEKGERARLNLGHTLGHAIEQAGAYRRHRHGEAIALGLRAAAWLSVHALNLPAGELRRIERALGQNQLPTVLGPEIESGRVLAALGHDKKNARDGSNRWVLLEAIGAARSGVAVPPTLVAQALEYLRQAPEHP